MSKSVYSKNAKFIDQQVDHKVVVAAGFFPGLLVLWWLSLYLVVELLWR